MFLNSIVFFPLNCCNKNKFSFPSLQCSVIRAEGSNDAPLRHNVTINGARRIFSGFSTVSCPLDSMSTTLNKYLIFFFFLNLVGSFCG